MSGQGRRQPAIGIGVDDDASTGRVDGCLHEVAVRTQHQDDIADVHSTRDVERVS
jgi:hypothetical protein